jgi:acyl-CoA hydrolase
MESFKLVLPTHLNHYGYLYGGNMLKWVDEYGWIAASTEHPGCKFVTVGMDKVEFHKSVKQGAILRFDVNSQSSGKTSIKYKVDVYSGNIETGVQEIVFTTTITFVCLDADDKPSPIGQ